MREIEGHNNAVAVKLAVATVALLVLALGSMTLGEHMDAGDIMVIQNPFTGKLVWYTTPGIKWQGGGKVTTYKKREQFWFSAKVDQGKKENESLRIRFNDGAHATISGSISWEMPTDEKHLTMLHAAYGSQHAVEQQLVRTVIEKCVYMTGPLMSSAESYAARRNDLLNLMADQIEKGVYKTTTKEVRAQDALTGSDKTVKVVELVKEDNGQYAREEASPIATYGVKTFNLSINEISYDPSVESQIQAQQKAIMDIQTSIANAKTAEQDALTTEQKGKAAAAKARWEQEVIKATSVTKAEQEYVVARTNALMKLEVSRLEAEAMRTNLVIAAEQKLEVAELALKAAELDKKKEIAMGEGEAKRRQLVMEADGALEKKLEAWVKVNEAYAAAIKGYQGNWVPGVVMGGTAGGGQPIGGANDLVQLLTVKTAQDLGLSLKLGTAASIQSVPVSEKTK